MDMTGDTPGRVSKGVEIDFNTITKRALAAAMASSESKVSTPSASKVAEGASKVVDSASAVAKDYSDADGLCGEL